MSKIKACILQNGFRHGGTDTFVINLCKEINRDLFDIEIINPENDLTKNILEERITQMGIPVFHTAGFSSFPSKLKHFWQLYKHLKQTKPDTFHTNVDLFNGPQLFVAALAGVKNRVCHSHNSSQGKGLANKTITVKIYQILMKWLCREFSTKMVGCSPEAMDFLFKGFNWRNQKFNPIVYNGIDLERFHDPLDVEKKKAELGLTAQKHIVTVGRIFFQKNPEFILSTFRAFHRKYPECDLIWVGIGDQMQEMIALASKYGLDKNIHFLGARDDVPEIMRCCDTFFLPSRFEGLGIVLVEAQAAGLNCVVSDVVPRLADCGGVRFISLKAPVEAWIDSLNNAIIGKGLNIDKNKLQNFSIDHMCKQMEKILVP